MEEAVRYSVNIEGFEDSNVEIETSGIFKGTSVYLDGKAVPKEKAKGEYLLTSIAGQQKVVLLKFVFLDPIPTVHVDGREIKLADPLTWYQWLWTMWPLILLFIGGALGGFLGGVFSMINIRIIRSNLNSVLRYSVTFAISALAMVLYIILATAIHSSVGK